MKIKSQIEWEGKIIPLLYKDTDSFDDLPIEKCTQCYGVCFCGDKIVIGRRKKGYWGLIGGTVEKGESLEETLRREIQEESNMKILDFRPIGYQEIISSDEENYFQLRYFCKVEPFGDFISDPDGSIIEIKLINPSEYKKYFGWGEIGERIVKRAIEIKSESEK